MLVFINLGTINYQRWLSQAYYETFFKTKPWYLNRCLFTRTLLVQILHIYINKDGNPSTKSTKHVDANVNKQKENQDHQNSNNEMEHAMLKGHPMLQIN